MAQPDTLASLASLPSPLPPVPEGEVFTTEQWQVMFSILEVFLPEISTSHKDKAVALSEAQLSTARAEILRYAPEGTANDVVDAYLSETVTSSPVLIEYVKRKFRLYIPPSDAKGLGFILSSLNTRLGSYLLTGSTTPIHEQPLATRTAIVTGWSTARLAPLRAVYRSMTGLARFAWLYTSTPLRKTIGFPDVPKHIERNPTYEYKFHDFTSPTASTSIAADVIIVGSGCGAGVSASHLARAGLKVLVLESAYHFPSTHFPMKASDGAEHLFLHGGFFTSDDASIGILAGSTFGGGGTVNWSASLQPQYAVRHEWASNGLPHFTSPEFQDCLDTVCDRMGVAKRTDPAALAKVEHNFANSMLLEGARREGMAVEIVPQNAGSKRHFCGSCNFGCASTTKQGPVNNWFPAAAAHGAEFIEGCFVEEVIFSKDSKSKTTPLGTATGVKAIWTSRDRQTKRALTITGKRVIIAAGTLNSPAVLQRSGLTNPHIGSNLHLHPTATLWSVWPQRTDPWDGSILTVVVTSFEDLDGYHHGPKIEVICSVPGIGLLTVPWRATSGSDSSSTSSTTNSPLRSALEYKINVSKYGHSAGFIVITRDQDTGRVYIDPTDPERRRIRVAYTPSTRDRANLWEGLLAATRLKYHMGALEIETGNPALPRFVRPSSRKTTSTSSETKVDNAEKATEAQKQKQKQKEEDDAAFEKWFQAIKDAGVVNPEAWMLGTAHQMGTCRMSGDAKSGVVDARGRVWGTQGLYVADASTFPSASGVNPMVSTMGIAEWVARDIVSEIQAEREGD